MGAPGMGMSVGPSLMHAVGSISGLTTTFRGSAREHFVASQFIARGFNIAWPAVDVGADLWVDSGERIVKIQIKTAIWSRRRRHERRNGKGRGRRLGFRWRIQATITQRKGAKPKGLSDYASWADFFVAVSPDLRRLWIMPTSEARSRSCKTLGRVWRDRWDLIGASPTESSSAHDGVAIQGDLLADLPDEAALA